MSDLVLQLSAAECEYLAANLSAADTWPPPKPRAWRPTRGTDVYIAAGGPQFCARLIALALTEKDAEIRLSPGEVWLIETLLTGRTKEKTPDGQPVRDLMLKVWRLIHRIHAADPEVFRQMVEEIAADIANVEEVRDAHHED